MEIEIEIEISDFIRENCSKVCRFCLGNEELSEIYQSDKSLIKKLGIYLEKGYIIHNDDLPNYCCSECLKMLENWSLFNEKCNISLAILQKINEEKLLYENKDDTLFVESKLGSVRSRRKTRNQNLELQRKRKTKQLVSTIKEEPCIVKIQNSNAENIKKSDHLEDSAQETTDLTQKKKYDRNKYAKVCPYCGIILKAHYKKHILNHEQPDSFPFKCDNCSKAYKNKKALVDHINRDHLGIRYPCEICGDFLTTKDILRLHKLSKHNNEANYKCDQCEKSFKTSKFLHKHRLRHSDFKKFMCSDCGRSFTNGSDLKEHIRVHTGEKPLNCKFCGKAFRQSSVLRTHLLIHTGRKPYACECGEAFTYKQTWLSHQKSHCLLKGQKTMDDVEEAPNNLNPVEELLII